MGHSCPTLLPMGGIGVRRQATGQELFATQNLLRSGYPPVCIRSPDKVRPSDYNELINLDSAGKNAREFIMLLETPLCNFGWRAVDFTLPDLDGKLHSPTDLNGPNGLLLAFICNHCPYVKAMIGRFVEDAIHLQAAGIGVAAIMSNDYHHYPDDAPDKMEAFARQHGFTFPYLLDESQQVARTYDAVCTPDFFGFNDKLELQYRGRIDEAPRDPAHSGRRELLEAMLQVANSGQGPNRQHASMGCSIKWKE